MQGGSLPGPGAAPGASGGHAAPREGAGTAPWLRPARLHRTPLRLILSLLAPVQSCKRKIILLLDSPCPYHHSLLVLSLHASFKGKMTQVAKESPTLGLGSRVGFRYNE